SFGAKSPPAGGLSCLSPIIRLRSSVSGFWTGRLHGLKSSRRGRLAPVLSHHLACGSAPGGSEELTKCQVTFKHADQPLRLKISGVKGVVQVAGHLPWPPA